MKKFLCLLVMAVVVTLLVPVQSQAQATVTRDTAISINLPNVVILQYYSTVYLRIPSGVLEGIMFTTGNYVDEGLRSETLSATLTADLATPLPSPPDGDPTALVVVLSNAWAVRSIGTPGNTTSLAVNVQSGTLNHGTSGSITIANALASIDGSTWLTPVTFPHTGLANPQNGHMRFSMDLTNATLVGDYTGGTIRITATAN